MKTGEIKKLKLSDIVPYWRNPRNNQKTVDHVRKSIEDYGYKVPIVVDEDNVILAGHVRYKALLSLGWEEVEVCVVDWLTQDQRRQYRIADNKASEKSNWDIEKLKKELHGLGDVENVFSIFQQGDWRHTLELNDQMGEWEKKIAEENAKAMATTGAAAQGDVETPTFTPSTPAEFSTSSEGGEQDQEPAGEASVGTGGDYSDGEGKQTGDSEENYSDDSEGTQNDEEEKEELADLGRINLVCPNCGETLSMSKEEVLEAAAEYEG